MFFFILQEHMWRPVGAGQVRSMEAQNAYTGIKTGQANKNIWKHRGHVHTYACWSKFWPLRIWVDFRVRLGGGGRPDWGRAGRIWGGPKLDFRDFFSLTASDIWNKKKVRFWQKWGQRNLPKSKKSEGGVAQFSRTRKKKSRGRSRQKYLPGGKKLAFSTPVEVFEPV